MGFDNRAPVAVEQDFVGVRVSGEIPSGLRGTLFRNGPNPLPGEPDGHWFMGHGMVHAFCIGDDGVSYKNRWVRTAHWGDAAGPGGVANTNIVAHGGRLLALEEMHLPVAVDGISLATLGAVDFAGGISEGPFTAHPKWDPASGAMVFFGYGIGGPGSDIIRIGELGVDGRVIRVESGRAPFAAMVHDFAVTERYVAIPLFPLVDYMWQPGRGAWLGVMDRAVGISSLRWHRAGAGFAFHTMNAWEEDGALVIDLMLSDAPPFFPGVDGTVPPASDAVLWRWTLDVVNPEASVDALQLSSIHGEFPRIDERFSGRKTRHGYFTSFDGVWHRHSVSGRESVFRVPAGDSVSEPVFVARGAAEGDGWLLVVIYRAESGLSDLAILDAADVAAGPVALAHLPCRVPAGFHGNWVGDAS